MRFSFSQAGLKAPAAFMPDKEKRMRILAVIVFASAIVLPAVALAAEAPAAVNSPAAIQAPVDSTATVQAAAVESTSALPAVESTAAASPAGGSKIEHIRQLMAVNNTDKMARQLAPIIISNWKARMPRVPEEFWQKLSTELSTDDLERQMVTIYDRYLTDDDIKAFLAFYETPAGKKMNEVMPKIQVDANSAATAWMKDSYEMVLQKLQAGGYIAANRPTPAVPAAPAVESTAPAAR
jgi:uncharacterized protein